MLSYDMGKRGDSSLYEYLYQQIRDDIMAGRIAADEHLPSKRALAEHLGLSVVTVENAYAQLVAEGYVRAEARRGFYANKIVEAPSAPVRAGETLDRDVRDERSRGT